MAVKKKVTSIVEAHKKLADGIYDMWLKTKLSSEASSGMFVGVYPKDSAHLLPRPISICEVDKAKGLLRLVYRIQGEGTREFSGLKENDEVKILGILGNGFPVEEGKGKKAVLMGGGIGIPPLLQLSKELEGTKEILLGYRNSDLFLSEEFKPYGNVVIATEDGSIGTKGNVMDALKAKNIEADIIYACGPLPMLKAIKEYAESKGIKSYLSLEERMACGVGACLGCVCKTKETDHHSHVNNARICTEGPVFLSTDIII